MKYTSLLFTMPLTLASCNKDDVTTAKNLCDFETMLSATHYRNVPSNYIYIDSLEIIDDCLIIEFTASECSADTWEVN